MRLYYTEQFVLDIYGDYLAQLSLANLVLTFS